VRGGAVANLAAGGHGQRDAVEYEGETAGRGQQSAARDLARPVYRYEKPGLLALGRPEAAKSTRLWKVREGAPIPNRYACAEDQPVRS